MEDLESGSRFSSRLPKGEEDHFSLCVRVSIGGGPSSGSTMSLAIRMVTHSCGQSSGVFVIC